MREKSHNRTYAGAVLIACTIAVAGCSESQQADPAATASVISSPPVVLTDLEPEHSPSPAAVPTQTPLPEKVHTSNEVQQAAAADKKDKTLIPSPTKAPVTFDPYTFDDPRLMGVAIGESKDRAVKLHGKPKSTYSMEDGEDALTVYEYSGFSLGFSGELKIEFVEITTDEVDPGLNGFRLGQSVTKAQSALGKPDTSSDYVWSYKTIQTILKLDVDPKTKSVQSIKLFGRT